MNLKQTPDFFSRKLKTVFTGLFLFFFLVSNAQQDSTKQIVLLDSANKVKATKPAARDPKKAAIMSACLPGLGQAYNKKYWKIPIIYAGLGGLGYGIYFNHTYYKKYSTALRFRYDDDATTIDPYTSFSDDNLVTLKRTYQRWRDLCIIGSAALYTLNVIDAVVDAHLSSFDVSDDLSIHVRPGMNYSFNSMQPTIGIGLQF
ncbi:MAG: DUF5683 domain-containing protein [Bacteroidia bacterium]